LENWGYRFTFAVHIFKTLFPNAVKISIYNGRKNETAKTRQ